jgi:tetratricopeptide (TPR) repeat protein
VVLFGALGLAVLFVVLVLPRWVRSPGPAAPDRDAEAVASEEALEPTPEPEAPGPPPEAAPPPRMAEAAPPPKPPLPAEAPPAPSIPRERSRSKPATSEPPAPAAPAPPPGEEEFVAAMSAAQSALERRDWASARSALGRATTLRPGSPSVSDLRRRVEAGERLAALARQREKARGFEAQEEWRRALAEYEAALKLDPTVTFALEGRSRTKTRSELAERLDFHISNPLRLATDSVAREAERLLQEAREVSSPGPRHRRQIADLEKALVTARTPVAVILESDGETEVVVHKVGRLGAFNEKRLDLRPGTYTVIGTRRGFRDVRRQLVVNPAAAPPPLVVRCEEEI